MVPRLLQAQVFDRELRQIWVTGKRRLRYNILQWYGSPL